MEISLYIHFPFCVKKCLYCDFNSVSGSGIAPVEYADAVVREMELRAPMLPSPSTAPTLYFGGGTPSLLPPGSVARVIDAAARLFGLTADAEITIEANPGTVAREQLAGYLKGGVNRLSLGIQTFHDPLLARLGRVHSAQEAVAAFVAARAAGFDNVGIDLIHSLPGEPLPMWQADLAAAVSLGPEHISAYALTVEEGTPFHRLAAEGRLNLPEEDEALAMLEGTAAYLHGEGYAQYEISNFARPGFRSRHNQVYWQRGEYLGFGAGAHSFRKSPGRGTRWHNTLSPQGYLQAVMGGAIPEEGHSLLTEREARAEFLFLGLRMLEGVEEERFEREFGLSLDAAYPGVVARLGRDGLLERREGRLRLSDRGVALANRVFAAFL